MARRRPASCSGAGRRAAAASGRPSASARRRPSGTPARWPPRSASSARARAAGRPTRAPARRRPAAPAARTALLAAAQEALQADAATRRAGRIRGLDCEPFPRGSAETPARRATSSRRSAAYQCVAVTSRFGEGSGQEGVIGIPFRLVARFARGSYAFCRIVPLSDRDRLTHPLPAACRL